MPIRPEMRARYPKDWKQIRAKILKRAEYACECTGECGDEHGGRCAVPNHAMVVRSLRVVRGCYSVRRTFVLWEPHSHEERACLGKSCPGVVVVLTIAHVHDKSP